MKQEYNSIANQDVKEQLVRREVIYCVSSLMWELKSNLIEGWEEEIYDAFQSDPDYEEAAAQLGWESSQYGFSNEDEISEADDWDELCEERDIEPYCSEIYEHWIVTDFLARKLEEQGEKILWDFMGLTIWGRTCSGQAILLDYSIGRIAEGMKILEGQENHQYWRK